MFIYWGANPAPRYQRRAIVRAASLTSAGLAAAGLLGCRQQNKPSGPGTTGNQGAGGQVSGGQPQSGGTLNLTVTQNTVTFDPHRSTTAAAAYGGFLSRLFRYKSGPNPQVAMDQQLENDLALSAESSDAITWTFKLRPNANFQDIPPVNGHAVEAEDTKASFTRALTSPSNPNRSTLNMIDAAQVSTPAQDTVTFKLNYPYAGFPDLMASPLHSWILPREALAGAYDPSKQFIGSGPFQVDRYTPDVALVLKKNPRWFEQGRPYVDEVRVAIIRDESQALAQFMAGHLDELIPGNNTFETVKRDRPQAQQFTGFTTSGGGRPLYFQLGDQTSPFQDVRVRRAVTLAIDRQAIGKALFNDQYGLAFMVPLGFGRWALADKDLPPETAQWYRYDPAQAKKLLTEAGETNLAFKYDYVSNWPTNASVLNQQDFSVNNMLNAAGFTTSLVPLDFQRDFEDAGKGVLQGYYDKNTIVSGGVYSFPNVELLIFLYFHSKSTTSQSQLHDSALDAMIDKARTIINRDERVKAYKDIQKYIADKVYTVSDMPQPHDYRVVQPSVQNYCYSNNSAQLTETTAKAWLKRN